jgi:hypothetical protein
MSINQKDEPIANDAIGKTLKKLKKRLKDEIHPVKIALIKETINGVNDFKSLVERTNMTTDKVSQFLFFEVTGLCDMMEAI